MIFFEEVEVGQEIPERKVVPTNIQMFRFSAITWNAHLIHYNKEYAQTEGYPDIIVQSHLHGAYLATTLTNWIGPHGKILSYDWKNKKYATVGEELTFKGRVIGKEENGNTVICEIYEENSDGEKCVSGQARLFLPSKH